MIEYILVVLLFCERVIKEYLNEKQNVLVVILSLLTLLIGLPSFLFSPFDDDVEGVGAVESITTFFSSPTNVGSFPVVVTFVVATLEDFVLLTVLP